MGKRDVFVCIFLGVLELDPEQPVWCSWYAFSSVCFLYEWDRGGTALHCIGWVRMLSSYSCLQEGDELVIGNILHVVESMGWTWVDVVDPRREE